MRRWNPRRALAALAALALPLPQIACSSLGVGSHRNAPDPTVWSARLPGSDSRTFLLGSVHVGNSQLKDLGPVLDWVFSDAQELVLEVDLSQYGDKEAARLADRYGRIEAPATLADRVSPETYRMLSDYLVAHGLAPKDFDDLQPWLVATAIEVLEFRQMGFDPELGVDSLLRERAAGSKPVRGLETPESQYAMFADLPDPVQDLMLRDMLERTVGFADEAREMLRAWRRGDESTLERIVFRRTDDPAYKPFYEKVLFDRNERMAERIAALAADGKTRLVVVGAAHLLGDRGVPALLESRGFEVERMAAP